MATLLRTFHPYTHAPQRHARFVCGAVLALAGFVLLTGQLLAALAGSAFAVALQGGLLAAAATTLGALPILAVRRIDGRWQRLVLAAGAGAMTAAVISLWQQAQIASGSVSLTMLAGVAGGMLHTVRHDLLPSALHGPQRLQALLACAAGALLLCSVAQIA